jgi:hypothetical protein
MSQQTLPRRTPMTTTMPVPPRAPQTAPPAATKRTFIPHLFLGKPEDPRWVLPSLIALLLVTAVLYLWGLGESGWANAFYSAAAQAGSESWKAFFYGSSDAANAITIDKTPASLWVMTLSVRIFGLSSWSVLVPQAWAWPPRDCCSPRYAGGTGLRRD